MFSAGAAGLWMLVLMITCALYASFGLYLTYVWTATGRVDCGCLGRGETVGPLTVLHALLLATAAALGSIASDLAARPSLERWRSAACRGLAPGRPREGVVGAVLEFHSQCLLDSDQSGRQHSRSGHRGRGHREEDRHQPPPGAGPQPGGPAAYGISARDPLSVPPYQVRGLLVVSDSLAARADAPSPS